MNSDSISSSSFIDAFPEQHRVMVLLVDDQTIVGEAVRRQLAGQADVDFHYCAEGSIAVQLASEIKPTVILQDLIMPGVDGLTLVRQYRQNPETKSIPIVVLSTKEDPEIKSRAFSCGANDYLVKLPDKAELIARIYYHSHAYLSQIERDEAYRALRKSQRQLVDGNMTLTLLTEKLRQNNEALQAAERLARMGNWSWDIARDHATWSGMLYEIFLWDKTQPAPRYDELKAIFTPESLSAFQKVTEQCMQFGLPYSLDLEGVRTDGEHFFVNAKGQAARDTFDKIVGLFGTMHDITESRRLSEIAQQSAVLEERARIAGEIHDSLAQSFTAILLQTEIAEEYLSGNEVELAISPLLKARELARFGLGEARRSAHTLRPSPALQAGLVHALKQLFQRTSVKDFLRCETKVAGTPRRLDPMIEHEIFRIAQEGLSNAVRHAKSNRITLDLHFKPDGIAMVIEDNGIGFRLDEISGMEGFGLQTMRERAEKMGGTFTLSDHSGKGTRLVLTIPDRCTLNQKSK